MWSLGECQLTAVVDLVSRSPEPQFRKRDTEPPLLHPGAGGVGADIKTLLQPVARDGATIDTLLHPVARDGATIATLLHPVAGDGATLTPFLHPLTLFTVPLHHPSPLSPPPSDPHPLS